MWAWACEGFAVLGAHDKTPQPWPSCLLRLRPIRLVDTVGTARSACSIMPELAASRGRLLRLGTWRPAGKFGRFFQGPGTSDHCWNGGSVALESMIVFGTWAGGGTR